MGIVPFYRESSHNAVNSCITGANSYYISGEERELEPGIEPHRLDRAHHYREITSFGSGSRWWLVCNQEEGQKNALAQLRSLLMSRQGDLFGWPHVFWPVDMIYAEDCSGWVIHPIDETRYEPIQRFLFRQRRDADQLSVARLALSLFSRLRELHEANLTLNGFRRDQVRVDRKNRTVCIWPGATAADTRTSAENIIPSKNGFLSVPTRGENLLMLVVQNTREMGQMRDIFSAGVLAFYLLYHIHPFVGSRFWELSQEEYLSAFHQRPSFIFAKDTDNPLHVQDFEVAITQRWNKTPTEITKLFQDLLSFRNWKEVQSARHWEEVLHHNVDELQQQETDDPFDYSVMRNYQI